MNKVPRGLQKGSSEIEEAEVDEVPNGLQDDHWIQVKFHFSNRKFDEAKGAERFARRYYCWAFLFFGGEGGGV